MIVFCYDVDNRYEEVFKYVMHHENIGVEQFYFNIKPDEKDSAFSGECIVVFIDTRIHEKKKNGFYMAKYFRDRFPKCHIVFTSLYPEDMSHCFKNLIRPSGFLLKPINVTEIAEILHNINQYEKKLCKTTVIPVTTRDFKYNIKIDKIYYFSTIGKKLYVKTTDNERIEFYGTISSLEKDYDMFVRCHNGFLVNKMYIKGIKKGELELVGCEETLPISKKYKNVLRENEIN